MKVCIECKYYRIINIYEYLLCSLACFPQRSNLTKCITVFHSDAYENT